MNMQEIYNELLSKYADKQVVVAIEELSELQKELCKYLRGKLNKKHILEEYVDVLIMMEQMKILFNLQDEDIQDMKNYKLNRLKERLRGEMIDE